MPVSPTLRAALLILIAGGAVYANSLQNGFTFDDHAIVERNPVLQSSDFLQIWKTPYWPGGWKYGLYRPVTTTSYALNRSITGPGPFGFHVVNVMLHLLTAMMVFSVVRTWVSDTGATAAALIFALHPVQSEAVNGIVGRADVLAALLALVAWRLYRRPEPPWRLGSVVAFAAALLAKEGALVLPAILIMEDAARAHTPRVIFLRWKRYLPYVIVGMLFLALRATLVGSVGLPESPRLVDNPLASVSTMSRGFTAVAILARYVGLILAPIHLSPDYTYNQIPALTDPFDLWIVAGLALLIGSALLLRRRRTRAEGFGIGMFWLALLPLSNLVFLVGTNFGERLLYFPMIGVCVVAGWGYDQLQARFGGVFPAWLAVVALCAALGARTAFRNVDWQSDLTLFTAASVTSPGSAKVHLNLGNALSEAGDAAAAIRAYEQALAIHSDYADAHHNRGVIFQEQGRMADARLAYDRALEADHSHVGSLVNRGIISARIGDARSAIVHLERAVEIEPSRVDAWYNYGVALDRAGRDVDAKVAFAKALSLDPANEGAAIGLASLYRSAEQTDSLIVTYRRLLGHNRSALQASYNFGVELERLGRVEEAIGVFQDGSRDTSDRGAMSLYRAALLLDRSGDREAARQSYRNFLDRWGKTDAYRQSAEQAIEKLDEP